MPDDDLSGADIIQRFRNAAPTPTDAGSPDTAPPSAAPTSGADIIQRFKDASAAGATTNGAPVTTEPSVWDKVVAGIGRGVRDVTDPLGMLVARGAEAVLPKSLLQPGAVDTTSPDYLAGSNGTPGGYAQRDRHGPKNGQHRNEGQKPGSLYRQPHDVRASAGDL